MKPLTAEISEDMLNDFQEVVDSNPGWDKTLVVRALVNYFLKLEPEAQQNFVRRYQVKLVKRQTE